MMKICYFFCINMLLMFVQLYYTVYNVWLYTAYIYRYIYIYTLPKCYLEPVSLFLYKTFFWKSRKQKKNKQEILYYYYYMAVHPITHTHKTISFLFNLSTNRTTFPNFFFKSSRSISVSILSNIIILYVCVQCARLLSPTQFNL